MLGPNSAIDLAVDGDFLFAEPSGSSWLNTRRRSHVEALMDRSSLAFLYGQEGTKTARGRLHGAQIQAQVKTLIENKESAFDLALRLWCVYTKEKIDNETGIEISDNLIQRPLDNRGQTT